MILSHFVLYVRNFTFQLHGLVVLLGLVIIFFMGGDPFHVNNYWDHFHSFSDCTFYYIMCNPFAPMFFWIKLYVIC